MKKIIVLYHARCADGTGAAWAAWKKFGTKALYLPIEPRVVPKIDWKGKEVYVMDNSFFPKHSHMIQAVAKRFVTIDHHISSKVDIEATREYVFDTNHSGSVLAWRFFHPRKPIPRLLLHVEDFDLWKFKLDGTRSMMAYFSWCGYDLNVFIKLAEEFQAQARRKKILERGGIFREYEEYMTRRLVKNAERVRCEGHEVLALNSPILNSEAGQALWKMKPPFSIVWHERDGRRYYSLRANKNGNFDVSAIAKKYGGGGHKPAAGFSMSIEEGFPWKVIKK